MQNSKKWSGESMKMCLKKRAARARAPPGARVRGLGYILYTIAFARTRRDQPMVPIENRFTVVAQRSVLGVLFRAKTKAGQSKPDKPFSLDLRSPPLRRRTIRTTRTEQFRLRKPQNDLPRIFGFAQGRSVIPLHVLQALPLAKLPPSGQDP